MTLRELLDAFPQGMFVSYHEGDEDVEGEGEWRVLERLGEIGADQIASCTSEKQAHLIALAPELAALVLDMADALRQVNGWDDVVGPLLARLDRIGSGSA